MPFVHYTPESENHPLPSAEVYRAHQTRSGYLWFAVFTSGLVRYDGRTMRLYDRDDGLHDLDVRNMVEDGLGRLWVSSDAGLVVSEHPMEVYAQGQELRFVDAIGGTPLLQSAVNQNGLAVDGQGSIWVGTLGLGVVRYRPAGAGRVEVDTLSTALPGETLPRTVHAILPRSDGSVWVSLSQGYVMVFPEAGEPTLIHPDTGDEAHVNVFLEDARRTVWAGTSDGRLRRWNATRGVFEDATDPVGGYVVSLEVSRDSVLWVGSEGAAVSRFQLPDLAPLPAISVAQGLLSRNLHDILEDREGNLWFAQSGGVSKLRPNHAAFTYLTARRYPAREPALPSKTVTAVVEGNAATDGCWLWVGTLEGGVVCVRRDYSAYALDASDGLRGDEVDALVVDADNRLWLGTAYGINGVSFPQSTRPLPPAAVDGSVALDRGAGRLASYRGTSIYSARRRLLRRNLEDDASVESVWLPGYRSLYGLIDNRWVVFRSDSGLPSTAYTMAEIDEAGYLWVGTIAEGLYRTTAPFTVASLEVMTRVEVPFQLEGRRGVFGEEIKSVVFERIEPADAPVTLRTIESLLSRDGVLWIGTSEGVMAIEGTPPRVTTHLTARDGLGADNGISIAASPDGGTLWVGSNGGLAEVDPETRTVRRLVTKQDGLLDNEAWMRGSVYAGRDGAVYYGSPNGVTIYRPELDHRVNIPPVLAINDVAFAGTVRGMNDITIEYAGLSFSDEAAVRYRTRLLGYDAAWSAETADTKIRYTNLPAYGVGRAYTFELLARSGSGQWAAEPLRYPFTVQPPWWLRWWAFGLYAGLIVGIVMAMGRVQRSRLLRQERARQEMEHSRLRAEAAELQARILQADNERQELELAKARELEEAYVHLKATQAQLVQAEKQASLGKLTAGIAHEIKNPLNFINNFAELSEEYAAELQRHLEDVGQRPIEEVREDLGELAGHMQLSAQKILQHGGRLDQIVRSMIEHAEATGTERRQVAMNLFIEEYLTHALHSHTAAHPTVEIEVKRDYDAAVGVLEINPRDFSRVLLNLLNNAFYAVRERLNQTPAAYTPQVTVRTHRAGDRLEIAIEDNGVGIPLEIQHRIFEPFFTTKPTGSGTGLGLSMSYEIVTNGYRGRLTVESEAGRGARFVVSVPHP